MLIGIVADIHEATLPLTRALAEFRARGVDRIVSLGDACDTFSPVGHAAETVGLLRAARAIGVWGNHDFGLCRDVPERIRTGTPPDVLEYLATMQPHVTLAGCRFSHVEPWLNANRVEDLWYFDGPPDTPAQAGRSFAAVPEQFLFVGHFHRWLVTTPQARLAWDGESPLLLDAARRHLIVVAPVFGGWCATFDTKRCVLTPICCGVE